MLGRRPGPGGLLTSVGTSMAGMRCSAGLGLEGAGEDKCRWGRRYADGLEGVCREERLRHEVRARWRRWLLWARHAAFRGLLC